MIKDVNSLSDIEFANFKDAYKRYFEEYASLPVPGLLNKLKNFKIKVNRGEYVEAMLEALLKGERIGLVMVSNNNVQSFITGRIYENSEGWISHFYIDKELYGNVRRSVTLQIYKAFSDVMKEKGVKTVSTEASYYDPRFIDALETLAFSPGEEYEDDAVLYERRI